MVKEEKVLKKAKVALAKAEIVFEKSNFRKAADLYQKAAENFQILHEWKIAEATHNYVIENYTSENGFLGTFPKKNQDGGDKLYAITYEAETKDVLKAINKGRFLINYSGHGTRTSWKGPEVQIEDIYKLENKALPYVISNACLTGDFAHEEESFGAQLPWLLLLLALAAAAIFLFTLPMEMRGTGFMH